MYLPCKRIQEQYAALLLCFVEDNEADAQRMYLSDPETLLGMATFLPMLHDINSFVLACQGRHVYVGDLVKRLDAMRDNIRNKFVEESSFSALHFPRLHRLISDISTTSTPLRWHVADGATDETLHWVFADSEVYEMAGKPPPTGQAGRPANRPRPITRAVLLLIIARIKSECRHAAQLFLGELRPRFPLSDLLSAFSITSDYWRGKSAANSDDQALFLKHLDVLKQHFGATKASIANPGSTIPSPLSASELELQGGDFFMAAVSAVELMDQQAAVAAAALAKAQAATDQAKTKAKARAPLARPKAPPVTTSTTGEDSAAKLAPATVFWRTLASSSEFTSKCTEYLLLGELAMVMVTGSVEDERIFSVLKLIKTPIRNRLAEPHLNCLVRLSADRFFAHESAAAALGRKAFPFSRAIAIWLSKRSRYRVS